MAIYSLGGIDFSSKDAIKKHVRRIFAAYQAGESLSPVHQEFVENLLEWHPRASRKIGCGVDRIEIHIPKPWNTKGFLIVRKDGSKTDFSYLQCLNPRLADQDVKFEAACRRAIAWEVAEFKRQAFAGTASIWSEIDGRNVEWAEAHVDHYPVPFCDLVDRYVAETGLEVKSIQFADADGQVGVKLLDRRLERDFAIWHRQNASLRIISGSLNIRLGAHGRTA